MVFEKFDAGKNHFVPLRQNFRQLETGIKMTRAVI
jgi:hypothetical protein